VRFEDVDPAGIVFFPKYLGFAHEAMEHFFEELEGGYPRLIVGRRVGLPAVSVNMAFHAPSRYGDVLRIETTTAKLGNRSATLRYRMFRQGDGVLSVVVEHTVVCSDLVELASCPMPEDMRAIFAAHLEAEATGA
jgi:4-hydroxybenzoyl-CoA thioesterase